MRSLVILISRLDSYGIVSGMISGHITLLTGGLFVVEGLRKEFKPSGCKAGRLFRFIS